MTSPGNPTLLALRIVGLVWAQAPLVVGAFGWGVVAGHLTGEEPDVALTSDLVRHAGLIACAVLTALRSARGWRGLLLRVVPALVWIGLVALQQAVQPRVPIGV